MTPIVLGFRGAGLKLMAGVLDAFGVQPAEQGPDPRYILLRRDGLQEAVPVEGAPTLELRYEDLTHPRAAPLALKKLTAFLEVDPGKVDAALATIHMRDTWGFGRIGIGVPYYKPVYEFFRWWTWVMVGGLEIGDSLLNNHVLRCEVPIPLAHNGLVKEFLETDADTMVLVEDDHCADQQIIRRMRNKPDNQKFDIVCASYVNRRDPIDAVVGFDFRGTMNGYGEVDVILRPMAVWEAGTQPHEGAALGLVFVRRWVLEAMLNGQDPEEYFWFDWRGRNSQDIQFYWKARQVGAKVGVDRDNPVGHVGKMVFTMEQFYKRRAEFLAKQKQTEVQDNG